MVNVMIKVDKIVGKSIFNNIILIFLFGVVFFLIGRILLRGVEFVFEGVLELGVECVVV